MTWKLLTDVVASVIMVVLPIGRTSAHTVPIKWHTMLPPNSVSDRTLTSQGLGRIRFGMTLRQVEAGLRATLTAHPDSYGNYNTCETATRKDGRDAGLYFMLEAGRLTRISVQSPSDRSRPPAISTALGIGVGSTEAATKRAYGVALRVEPHTDGNVFKVLDKGGGGGLVFETDGKLVLSLRSGNEPALEYSEGCE